MPFVRGTFREQAGVFSLGAVLPAAMRSKGGFLFAASSTLYAACSNL